MVILQCVLGEKSIAEFMLSLLNFNSHICLIILSANLVAMNKACVAKNKFTQQIPLGFVVCNKQTHFFAFEL